MKVSSIDNLDIPALAESYEAYYTTFKRENGRDATLEAKNGICNYIFKKS